MEEKPEIRLKKKTIIIEFEEELKDSTTYTLNFGNAIKDLHEGNKLQNYEYVFSTGEELDSLSVRGKLKYAHDLTVPEEAITIMLYTDLRDSVPLMDIPLYVGRSNDSGVFSVNNLKPDIYKVFALKDGNYNFLFDLPTEEIAFLDSSLTVDAELFRSMVEAAVPEDSTGPDSAQVLSTDPRFALLPSPDTLSMGTDSLSAMADSLVQKGPDYSSIYIDLMLFTEEVETQYLMNDLREDSRLIQLVFARPLTDSFSYQFVGMPLNEPVEVLEDFSLQRDSLNLWLKDSMDYRKDTLYLELNYTVKDTSFLDVTQTDTLRFIYRAPRAVKGRKGGEKRPKEKGELMEISTIRKGMNQHLHRPLRMDLDVPLEFFRDSLVQLWYIPDSVEIPASFSLRKDSLLPTRGWMLADWESAGQYRLQILPGALQPIYPVAHDTVDVRFKTRDVEYYGQILLNLEQVRHTLIVQLTSKDEVVRKLTVSQDGLYTFSFLSPGDYGIKIIHDLNENGKWDTGKYLEKRQPEPVELLPRNITVRSNWDHDVHMILQK
jgi:hypothetical protein